VVEESGGGEHPNSERAHYGREAPDRHHMVFSRSGFTNDLRARGERDPRVHLGLEELLDH
jgi:hypothetical protein